MEPVVMAAQPREPSSVPELVRERVPLTELTKPGFARKTETDVSQGRCCLSSVSVLEALVVEETVRYPITHSSTLLAFPPLPSTVW